MSISECFQFECDEWCDHDHLFCEKHEIEHQQKVKDVEAVKNET